NGLADMAITQQPQRSALDLATQCRGRARTVMPVTPSQASMGRNQRHRPGQDGGHDISRDRRPTAIAIAQGRAWRQPRPLDTVVASGAYLKKPYPLWPGHAGIQPDPDNHIGALISLNIGSIGQLIRQHPNPRVAFKRGAKILKISR